MQLKQYDRALRLIESALMLDDITDRDKLDLIYQSGLIYKHAGDYKKALKVFKKIFSIDQNFRSVAMEVKQLSTR
jgi:tetratricopeptide (TPR) repeat protein